MSWTAKQAAAALARNGWDLVRVPRRGQRERERWRVTSAVHGEDYAFMLLDEVERFWRSCFIGLVEAKTDAHLVGELHDKDLLGLRGTIDQWMAHGTQRMPSGLGQTVKERRAPAPLPVPRRWRRAMAEAGSVPARGRHDLRALVRAELARRGALCLHQLLPEAAVSRPVQRL